MSIPQELSLGGPPRALKILAAAALILALAATSPASQGTESPSVRRLSVYLQTATPGSEPDVRIRAPGLRCEIVSKQRITPSRPLLLIIDPASYAPIELRKRLSLLGEAISASAAFRDSGLEVRLGLPVLDGILSNPFTNAATLKAELLTTVEKYTPTSAERPAGNPGRTLDLIGAIIQKADSEGPVDCLLLAADRRIEEPDAAYLAKGVERRFLELCGRTGTTMYGFLDGNGVLGDICLATGGLTIPGSENPASVLRQVLEGRANGYVLEAPCLRNGGIGGRFEISVETGGAGGRSTARAPRAIWIHPDSAPATDYFHMREALEWVRRAGEGYTDGNATVALSFAENADREDPWNPQGACLAGKSAVILGDLPLAASWFSRAIRLDNAPGEAFALYGSAMQKLGRAEEALLMFESLTSPGETAKPPIRLQRARLLAASGKADEARQSYSTVLNTELDDGKVRAEYGILLVESGDVAAGQEQFRISLAKNAGNSLALAGNSRIALLQGRKEEALQLALQALHADARNPEAEAQLANVYAARQEWVPAIDHLKAAIALDPSRLSLTLALSDVYLQAGRASDADDLVRTALGSNPHSAALYRKLAEARLRNGNISSAVLGLETGAARSGAESAALFRSAAELREQRGEYGQALLDYRAALESSDRATAATLSSGLRQHLIYLALSLDGARELGGLRLAEELGLNGKIAATAPKEAAPEPPGQKNSTVPVPGGIAVLSRALAMDESELKSPDALERIVAAVVQANSAQINRVQNNPLKRSAIGVLRSYADLLAYLGRNRLLPADFDPAKEMKLVFSLAGTKEVTSRTTKFLAYFGMKYRVVQSKGNKPTIEFALKPETEKIRDRRQLLNCLGVNLQDGNLREITVMLRQDHLPLPFTTEALNTRILAVGKQAGRTELERLLLSPRSMKLYLALSSCSAATRDALLNSTAPGELLLSADVLASYGRYVDFHEAKLIVPGRLESWAALLEVRESETGPFISRFLSMDGGRPVALYAGLSVASPAVQGYFTASAERLRDLYRSLAPSSGAQLASAGKGLGGQGLGRVLRQFSVAQDSLSLNLDNSVVQRLLRSAGRRPDASGGKGGESVLVGVKDIPELAGGMKAGVQSSYSPLEITEFLRFLQTRRAGIWTEKSLDLLADTPAQAPVLIDLIGDLVLSTDAIARYLKYCRMLMDIGNAGWNVSRIRTSQSLFYLLSLLHRAGSLSSEEAAALLDRALQLMEIPDEPQFTIGIAGFLSRELSPVLSTNVNPGAGTNDVILRALAGPNQKQEFSFEGKRLGFDAPARRLERMQDAVKQQRFNPLPKLLETYRLLSEIANGDGRAPGLTSALAQQLRALETAQFSAGDSKILQQAVAHVDLEGLRNSYDAALRQDPGGSSLRQTCQEIAVALHTELGVTLLTYCYAYHGSSGIDALAFDANFVRKHSFLNGQSTGRAWTFAHTENSLDLGTYIAGSVSGIDSELGRLELAQSARDFAGGDKALLPALLLGMRAVPGQARSDRAQEYVALSLRFGRELLTLAASDSALEAWCNSYLSTFVPPARRERVELALSQLSPSAATAILSPSELFCLALHYLEASGRDDSTVTAVRDPAEGTPRIGEQGPGGASPVPTVASPILDRLRQLARQVQAPDGLLFRTELEQYGVLVRRRVGLREFTLETPEPYEYLDLNVSKDLLNERMNDVKIRLAELHYSLGIPAYVAEADGEFALREILLGPPGTKSSGWQRALEKTAQLRSDNVRGWIDECLNRGLLTLAEQKAGDGRSAP